MRRRRNGASDTHMPDPTQLPHVELVHQIAGVTVEEPQDFLGDWPEGISHIVDWARNTGPVIPDVHRIVLLAIAAHAAEDGFASVSMAKLAWLVGCSRQAVARRIMFLEDHELLEQEEHITDKGLGYRYLLTGLDRNWVRLPKDPSHAPTVAGAYRARLQSLQGRIQEAEAESARKDDIIRRLLEERGDAGGLEEVLPERSGAGRGGGMLHGETSPVVVVVEPESSDKSSDDFSLGIENPNTTTTTDGGDVTSQRNIPPHDEKMERVHAFVFRPEVWAVHGASAENPGGWKSRTSAIRWYVANYDSAPDGSLSFLEQEYIFSREAEEERLEREAEDAEAEAEIEAEGAESREQAETADPEVGRIWKLVLGELQLQVPKPMFETWLKRTAGVRMDDEVFVVGAPTTFSVEWLERRMYHAIQTIVQRVTMKPLEVRFQVWGSAGFNE